MQKASRIFGSMHHLKFADVERIDFGKIGAAAFFHARQHGFQLLLADALAREQAAQHRIRRVAMNLRQHVDQKLRLRAVVRRIAVDLEKAGQAVDQVVDGGREVGTAVAAAPLIEKQAVAFVFLERRGIEDAQDVIIHAHCVDLVDALTRGAPIQCVDILQHGEDFGVGHLLVQNARQMSRSKVRFAEQHEDHRIGMPLADFGNLGGGVTIARSDLAQVFAGHAIEAVDAPRRDRARRPAVRGTDVQS